MSVIVTDGKTKIGVYKIPQRKKLCLCVEEGNKINVYGTFTNQASAAAFMYSFVNFIGAVKIEEGGEADET